jgi:hypothetical protein
MAVRQTRPTHGNTAATAALLVLAGWFAAPALAAPDLDPLCAEDRKATLEIKTDTVATTIEAVADDNLLKPRVAAAAREVFADRISETETEEVVEIESDDDDTAAPRLRPLTDNELVPFKRQMYRRDI